MNDAVDHCLNAFWKQFVGIAEMLEQTHVLYDMLFDQELSLKGLAGHRVLILPNSVCLSDRQCADIAMWVRNGGTLVATYETSICDELGQPRGNFGLAGPMGINYRGTYDRHGSGGTVYVPQGELKGPFGNWLLFCGQHTEFAPHEGWKVDMLCTLSTFKALQYGSTGGIIAPGTDVHDSGHPGVSLHPFGKGRSMYVSGDIGTAFSDHPLPRVRRFFAELLRRGGPQLEVDAPARVQATALRVDDHTVNVHLYHRMRPMVPWDFHHWNVQQWAALDEPTPEHNIVISFNEGEIVSAEMPLRGLSLQVQGGNTVTVPEVYLHDVVQCRLAPAPATESPAAAQEKEAARA